MNDGVPLPAPIVAVRDVLANLGFVEDWHAMTEQQPGFKFKRGNLDLAANQVTSLYLRPEFFFGGIWATARSLRSIEFSMPLKVESTEQAVAWIVYGIGTDFAPSQPIDWFEDGKRWQDQLPWERHRRRLLEFDEEYRRLRRARPHCMVARKWMRILIRHMRAAAEGAGDDEEFVAEFDGQMFKVTLPSETIAAPATGPAPWVGAHRGSVVKFGGRHRKLMTDPVEIGIWEHHLEIDRYRYQLKFDSEQNRP
jgi:hypothetical protein